MASSSDISFGQGNGQLTIKYISGSSGIHSLHIETGNQFPDSRCWIGQKGTLGTHGNNHGFDTLVDAVPLLPLRASLIVTTIPVKRFCFGFIGGNNGYMPARISSRNSAAGAGFRITLVLNSLHKFHCFLNCFQGCFKLDQAYSQPHEMPPRPHPGPPELSSALAPEATAMAFSPFSEMVIMAIPEGTSFADLNVLCIDVIQFVAS